LVESGLSVIAPPLKKLRLLLVDDSAVCRKLCRRLLADFCEDCEQGANGLEAVSKVKESIANDMPYDGILMDSKMPFMGGYAATKIIRELGYMGKIFGVTGNAYKTDIDDFISHGADAVFIKPLTLGDYALIIERLRETS
jgi:CheY-like chemotaxis protein